MTQGSKHKRDFRKSGRWIKFRKLLKNERKVDPITGSRLTKQCQCHHCCMKDDQYENLIPEWFEMLNPMSHKLIHFLFATRDWRSALKEVERILEKMESLN